MNPIYRFFLKKDSDAKVAVYPIYGNDLSIEWTQDSEYLFYRRTLSGKLTFVDKDYDLIMPQRNSYGSEFTLDIEISYDNGVTWAAYWTGLFYHTDCEIDFNNKKIVVTPSVKDNYTDVIAGLDKEFNLIDLEPAIYKINLKKRPIIQVYLAGKTRIGCFMGGMYWEQDCDAYYAGDTTLTDDFRFALNGGYIRMEVLQQSTPVLPSVMSGFFHRIRAGYLPTEVGFEKDFYEETIHYILRYDEGDFYIIRESGGVQTTLWKGFVSNWDSPITLEAQDSSVGGDISVKLHFGETVYCRLVTDATVVQTSPPITTYEIPSNDLVHDNRNYHRIAGFYVGGLISCTDTYLDTPTKWGWYEEEGYYHEPPQAQGVNYYPITHSLWDGVAYWFESSGMDDLISDKGQTDEVLRDAYMLTDAISLLLAKVSSTVIFGKTTAYSVFLNSADPITSAVRTYFLTPKSNVKKIDYDNPATKAPITLRTIFDMLRDCFKCYWFVDNNKLRIEHISFFNNGGSYDPTYLQVGVDLTNMVYSRNGKTFAFGQETITFDKPDMAARYEFGWMDDVTLPFNGEPLNVIGPYINKDKIEKINVSEFTSDIDYILINPSDISDDGFVLMAAKVEENEWTLPVIKLTNMDNVVIQNGYCAFAYMQTYYRYDMPTSSYTVGDNPNVQSAVSLHRNKTQEVKFPCPQDIDVQKLVKTLVGSGRIEKLTINLSSRNGTAILKYDPYDFS